MEFGPIHMNTSSQATTAPMNAQSVHAHQTASPSPSSSEAAAILKGMKGIVSPPDVYLRAMGLLHDQNAGTKAIADVIQTDANLTARLLGIVNSAFYGFRAPIDTVSRAVTVVGNRDLESLLTAASALQVFTNIPGALVNMDVFWRHSVFAASIAERLAKHFRVLHPERLFVAALLHDVGALIMFNRLPDLEAEILAAAAGDEGELANLETHHLGFDHAGLGALALRQWRLPESLCGAIDHHHNPAGAAEFQHECAIVHIADVLANRSGLGALLEGSVAIPLIDPVAWRILGETLPDDTLDGLIGEAGLDFAETVSLLGIGRR